MAFSPNVEKEAGVYGEAKGSRQWKPSDPGKVSRLEEQELKAAGLGWRKGSAVSLSTWLEKQGPECHD